MIVINKKSFGKMVLPMLILGVLLVGSGCKQEEQSESDVTQQQEVVIDHLEREVHLPENTDKILALNPLIMEGLFNIGITPIGKVDGYKIREDGIALPSVGGQGNINIEAIHELKPDLILAHVRNHGQIIEALEGTGAKVYMFDPGELGENPMLDSVEFLGNLLGREDEATVYMDSVNKVADELKEKIANQTDIKTAIIISAGDSIRAAQGASSYGSILKGLGLENIVQDNLPGSNKTTFIPFDIETIIEKDPDIILIVASSKDSEQNKEVIEKYKNDSNWKNLKAVKENRIKILPFKVNPGRSTAEDMLRISADVILSESK